MTSPADVPWALPPALGAAAAFGVGNVLQTRAARRVDSDDRVDPRLLTRLAVDRTWLGGIAAAAVGFGLQAVALFLAPVVVVQPLIVTELLFALPLAAALAGARLGQREWAGAVLVAVGLALFLVVTRPSGTRTDASPTAWALTASSVGVGAAILTAVASRSKHHPMLRASALAAAASACFGLMSILTKAVATQFDTDHVAALTHAQPWLLAVFALAGLLLAQTAFRIAPLSVSLPVIDVGEPLIAAVLAVTMFGEHLGSGWHVVTGVTAAALIVAVGVTLLDTSPLVRAAQHRLADDGDHNNLMLDTIGGTGLGSAPARTSIREPQRPDDPTA